MWRHVPNCSVYDGARGYTYAPFFLDGVFNFFRVLFPKRMGFGGGCEEGHDMFAYDIILTQQIGDDVDGARRAAMSP